MEQLVMPSELLIKEITDDTLEVFTLLHNWNVPEHVIERFLDLEINIKDLEYLSENTVNHLFQNDLKSEIKFHTRLSEWRRALQDQENNYCCKCKHAAEDSDPDPDPETAQPSKRLKRDEVFTEDIQGILSKTRKGNSIWTGYQKSNRLSDSDRDGLITCISEFYLDRDINLGRNDIKLLAEHIVKVFPTETQATYFVAASKGTEPSGTLFNKYRNMRRSYIRRGFIEKIDRASKKEQALNEQEHNIKSEVPEFLNLQDDENSIIADQKWLEKNFEPLDQVQLKWKNTIQLRCPEGRKYVLSLAKMKVEWPILVTPLAHTLINIDFEEKYGDFKPVVNWEKISQYVIAQLKISKKEYNPTNPNSKDIVCLLGLHKIFKPSMTTASNDAVVNHMRQEEGKNEKRKKHKYSILDSQKSQMEFCSNTIAATWNDVRVQPFIVVVGTKFDPRQYYTYVDNTYIEFDTFLAALDFCVKGYLLFDLSYPIQSEKVWYFLQESLYGIKSTKTTPKIQQVLNEMGQ